MNENHSYTLAELAEETGLTGRTVRYYIEKVLPPHHKQGRGKLARYGQDTLNSIRFIMLVGERYGFKPGQAKGVLARVPQETVDRVVRGEEELAVMTVPMDTANTLPPRASSLPRSSARMTKDQTSRQHSLKTARPMEDRMDLMAEAEMFEAEAEMFGAESEMEDFELTAYSIEDIISPWRSVFADDQLRIQYQGNHRLTPHQEEQIETAAHLIKLALK